VRSVASVCSLCDLTYIVLLFHCIKMERVFSIMTRRCTSQLLIEFSSKLVYRLVYVINSD